MVATAIVLAYHTTRRRLRVAELRRLPARERAGRHACQPAHPRACLAEADDAVVCESVCLLVEVLLDARHAAGRADSISHYRIRALRRLVRRHIVVVVFFVHACHHDCALDTRFVSRLLCNVRERVLKDRRMQNNAHKREKVCARGERGRSADRLRCRGGLLCRAQCPASPYSRI